MSKKTKHPTKNEQKKRKLIIVLSACAVATIVLIGIILGVVANSVKSFEKMGQILDNNGYDTYFYFDKNYYDNNGKCYKFDYSETTTCDREVGINDVNFFKIEILGGDLQMEAYYGFDENGKAKNRMISINKEVNDDDSLSYNFDSGGKNISLFYYKSDGESCYALYNDSDADEIDYCDESDNKVLIRFQKDVESLLKAMGITPNDLVTYFDGYLEWYVMPKYEAAKKDIETGISHEKAKEYIEEAGYAIESDDGTIILLDNNIYSYKVIGYYPNSNRLGYMNSYYDGYYLYYLVEDGYYLGMDDDSKCVYYIEIFAGSDSVDDESMALDCSEADKDQLDYLKFSFEQEIKRMNVTQNELIHFMQEYN